MLYKKVPDMKKLLLALLLLSTPVQAQFVWNGSGGGGGTGDVVGPASSTDNAITRWDGTTGKLLKDSPNTILTNAGVATTGGTTGQSPGWYAQIVGDTFARVRVGVNANDVASLALGPGSGARDLLLERSAAATLRFGATDAAAPVAQTLGVQNVVSGTSNTAGANWTFKGSSGTGTGVGGSLIFQTAPATTTGSTPNSFINSFTLAGSGQATFNNGTITTNAPFTILQNWNNSGTIFSAFTVNPTNTLASGASMIANFQITNADVFTFGNLAQGGAIGQSGGGTAGWLTRITTDTLSRTKIGLNTSNEGVLEFGPGGASSRDTILTRDAANTLAQRNGTTAQTFNIYNTFTNASNYEAAFLGWTGNKFFVTPTAAGTGTTRTMQLGGSGAAILDFATAGTVRWEINGSGHLLAFADNTYDIGASGATRPRTGYFGTSVVAANVTISTGAVQNPAGGSFLWTGRSRLASAVDGSITLSNNGSSDFGLLQFGGTTSSFPALKRSTTFLQARLADDSAFAPISVLSSQVVVTTVGSLGTCNAGAEGTMKAVSDALTPAFLVTLVGGGSVHTPAYCDGTNWIAN